MNKTMIRGKADFFDLWAPNYDFLLTTVFYQAIHKRLLEFIDLESQAKILDLGCGTGRLLQRLAKKFPNLEATGFDLSTEMLREAKRNNLYPERINFAQGNAEALPFADEEFNAVFNTVSFLHYPQPEKVLMEVKRVLRPGGKFYLADYTVRWEQEAVVVPFSPGGLRFYSPQKREEMARQVGLYIQAHHYLLGPVMLSIFVNSQTEKATLG